MIQRRKPLRRSMQGLQPKAPNPKPKRTPVKKRSRPRADVYAELRRVIHERAGGRCERCGTPLVDAFEAHHRKLRSQGGRDDVTNLVALDGDCHRWAHENPDAATAAGWIVRSHSKPENAAVTLWDGRTVRLLPLEDGAGYDVCWPAEGAAA